jgi:hypothetical protein
MQRIFCFSVFQRISSKYDDEHSNSSRRAARAHARECEHVMSYTTSTRAPARKSVKTQRAPARTRARVEQEIAETRVSFALATFAQTTRAQVIKNKHHVMSEMPARVAHSAPARVRMTRNVAPPRTRVDYSEVVFTASRAFNDDEFRKHCDAVQLAQHRAELARKRASESRRRT